MYWLKGSRFEWLYSPKNKESRHAAMPHKPARIFKCSTVDTSAACFAFTLAGSKSKMEGKWSAIVGMKRQRRGEWNRHGSWVKLQIGYLAICWPSNSITLLGCLWKNSTARSNLGIKPDSSMANPWSLGSLPLYPMFTPYYQCPHSSHPEVGNFS